MAETIALEFTDPAGEALRLEWDAEALARLDARLGRQPVWRLGGELDWDEVSELRVVSGHLERDRLIAVAALRPADAAGHGDEIVAGATGNPEALEQLAETLVSTEYGPDGAPRRIGLELYRDDGGIPLRVAGDVTEVSRETDGPVGRISAALELRAGGDVGVGTLEILRRG